MRILLSAFVCEPDAGSERGNGWTWAQRLARDHEVVVLTDSSFRSAIETRLAERPEPRLRVEYVGSGLRGLRGLRRVRYYGAWQRLALTRARELERAEPFDVVHHVTFGAHRLPSYLWKLDAPFVWGPVGGGEGVSPLFYLPRWMGWRESLREMARALSNLLVRVDPRVRRTAVNADVVAVTTEQTRRALPRSARARAQVLPSTIVQRHTLDELATATPRHGSPAGLRLVYAGRLLGWKGGGLALRAFAAYAEHRPAAELHVYGDGRNRRWLERLASRLGLEARVRFHGRVPRAELIGAYSGFNAFLFPSLHDSSGFVTIEAQAAGLPVVCLDTGGPGAQVPAAAGVKVAPRRPAQTVRDLVRGLDHLTDDTGAWRAASVAARAHALDPQATPSIETMIARLYGPVTGRAS